MEFIAGFAVGGLLFFVAGLFVRDMFDAKTRARSTTLARLEQAPPAPMPPAWPKPYPYQPPVIVLAAPRARVEQQHSTAVARR